MAENRTSEFLAMARSLPPQVAATAASPSSADIKSTNSTNNPTNIAKLKDFHNTAGGISRDIAATSGMLAELTQLVRQKSLFQDDSQQVNELVIRIKSAIENLNGRLDDAGKQSAWQKRSLGKNSQTAQASSNVVGQLQEEFGLAAKDFKSILQQRTDVMKETTDRKRDIYGNDEIEPIPTLNLENRPPVYSSSSDGGGIGMGGFPTLDLTSGMMPAGEPTGSQFPRPHGITASTSSSSGRSIPNYGASNYYGNAPQGAGGTATMLSPFEIQRMEQESGQDQTMQLIPDQDYLQSRADAMEQVEANIVELGAVYNRLATMVHEHKDMVQRVEDNVDEANNMVNLGMNQLVDVLHNLQTNRGLALKVFSILVVFIISFIIFAA